MKGEGAGGRRREKGDAAAFALGLCLIACLSNVVSVAVLVAPAIYLPQILLQYMLAYSI